ncbi:geraniol 8-hydroxylase-like protein [Tanacetum coccineum]
MLFNVMFYKDFSENVSISSEEFKDSAAGVLEVVGKTNLVDFFPILKPLDPQGLQKEGIVHVKKLLTVLDGIIDQRLQRRASLLSHEVSSTKDDELDLLLNLHLQEKSEFSPNDIRHLLFDLIIAGTDTSSTTLEWAMTELIRNPKKMETARIELNRLMENSNNKVIQEKDISQLPYLQAIIKETLRLHSSLPFLVPHQAIRDVEVGGFVMPKDAQILCNVCAIGRDPKVWSHPEKFMPERFLGGEIDYRGQNFELIPFGGGRRMCPGLNIAHRMLHLMLSSFIYNFDWKLKGNMKVEDLDMSEKFGIACPKNVPLKLVPTKL